MIYNTVFVTGGAGYCGSVLVPRLLKLGYRVTVYDIGWFGINFLPINNKNLSVVKGDIRDIERVEKYCRGHDVFLHLACISNDASFELDRALSTSINYDAFEPMVIAAKNGGISRFVYASSSSVYGVSDEPQVTETHPLVPLTLYNEYKGKCEPLLFDHTNSDFVGVVFRPATVCGYAPRLRLDLSVNILTHHAITKNKITVFGGEQLRPNLHIKDYCRTVELLLSAPSELLANEIFNVGRDNFSIMEIAQIVKHVVEENFLSQGAIDITTTPSDDMRSYHINSDKIKTTLGFSPLFSIEDAVYELCTAFTAGLISDSFENNNYYNVKRLKQLGVK